MMKAIFLLAVIATLAHAQTIGMGACPAVGVMNSIDVKKFAGKWYESERYPAFFDGGKCVVHSLMDLGIGHFLTSMSTDISTNVESTYLGLTAMVGPALPGQNLAIFPMAQLPAPLPFSIVNTDYTSYAVLYSCVDLSIAHIKFAWILSREKIASSTASNAAYGVMDWAKIDRKILQKVDHAACPANH